MLMGGHKPFGEIGWRHIDMFCVEAPLQSWASRLNQSRIVRLPVQSPLQNTFDLVLFRTQCFDIAEIIINIVCPVAAVPGI